MMEKQRVCLHVGGVGKIQKLMDFINTNALQKIVSYEGFVTGEKKAELLNSSDLFILPSYIEGLPIAILEAMSYSCPVLATTVGGIPEVVKDGETGFLFNAGDKESLEKKLINFIENKDLYTYMNQASEIVAAGYLPSQVKIALAHLYGTIV